MGLFDGFPFTSKEDRERRTKDFENRVAPHGVEAQRDRMREMMKELFPEMDSKDAMFVFFDAKDSYTKKEKGEAGRAAAAARLKKLRWVDERKTQIILAYVELESEIESMDDYPTAEQILARAFPEETFPE
ncbi:hypothetical protein AGMMS49983_18550 [Clostridia bacterium]|nr:hypothetical protein AGMMS49983_18550 [Clostridia bacterium]